MGISAAEDVAGSQPKSVEEEYNVGELASLLKSQQLHDVPKRYISEEGNIGTAQYADLAVIDLSRLQSDREGIVKEIGEAASKMGFMQVVNHNVPLHLIKKHEELAHKFFNMPREVKEKGAVNMFSGYIGGHLPDQFGSKILPWRESFVVSFIPDSRPEWFLDQIWREVDPTQTDIWTEYEEEISKLSSLMHEILAEHLGLSKDYFNQFFKVDQSRTRGGVGWNYYPPNPTPERVFGARRHFDPVSLTFLWQDEVGGLQVKGDHGEWLAVRPVESALVVNVGDLMEGWSNDIYKSVEHQVVTNAKQPRLSITTFVFPDLQTEISAPEEIMDEKNPRKYRPFTPYEYIYPNPVTAKYALGANRLEAFLI